MDERTIFLNALDITDPRARDQYLEEACGRNRELRRQLDELLRASSQAGEFLESPPAALVATIAPGSEANSAEEDYSLDFLAPSDKPGCLGQLAQYEVVELVGRGGMGLVLRAFDPKLNRVVAIKVMAPELAANPMAVKRFLREARAAAAVCHDHVVTIHHIHDTHRPPFLVMEFVDGQSLQQKIDRVGALELREILRIGIQIASGLAAAHKQGLVHRDVKPANVLLENGVERVKITDFGLARATDDVGVTQTGQIAGTPQYMSPEQAQGQPVDARSDLFSLGSVLYTLCTGRPPFRGDTAVAMLRRVCDDEPRPIRQVSPEIPDWLEAIVYKLLAKHPDDRFQSAEEVADLLSRHLAHLQRPTAVPMPQPVRFTSRPADGSVEKELQSTARYLWATGILSLVMGMLAVLLLIRVAVFGAGGLPSVAWPLFIINGLISLPVSLVIMFGARHAERRHSYGWAMAAAILSLIPFNLFLFFLIPITVWTIAGLRRPELRAAFRSAAMPSWEGQGAVLEEIPPPKKLLADHSAERNWGWMVPAGLFVVFALVAAMAAAVWFYRSTNYGIVVFDSPTDNLLIELVKDGHVERVYDTLHFGGTRWHVPVGEWEFRIQGDPNYRLTESRVAVTRGSQTVIRIIPEREVEKAASFLSETGRLEGHSDTIDCLAWSPDGKYLFSGGGDKMLFQWDVAERRITRKFPAGDFVISVAPLPDGNRILTGHYGGMITLWDLETGRPLRRFEGHTDQPRALAVSPDGKQLLSGAKDGSVRLWDVESGVIVQNFNAGFCNAVAISPDGSIAAHDSAAELQLWEIETGKPLRTLVRGKPPLGALVFSPDGRHLVGSNDSGEIRAWDVESGHDVYFLDGHEPGVGRSLAFVPGGEFLISGSDDRTIRVFRWSTGQEVDHIVCDASYSQRLALSPDGRTLAGGGGMVLKQDNGGAWIPVQEGDYAIRLWRVADGARSTKAPEELPP